MKVVVNSYNLAEAVNKVAKAVATKDLNGKILEGIKLVAKNGKLTLTAFDSEMSIQTEIKCDSFIDGEMVVAGKIFSEYVNKVAVAAEDIEIEQKDNGQAKMVCGKVKFAISTMNASEFPLINVIETENFVEMETVDFKRLVNQTVFCTSQDESRPILKGCLLETKQGKLVSYAVDGFRLAKSVSETKNANGDINCVVLSKALKEMSSMVGTEENSITIYAGKNNIVLKTGATILTARLLVGQFVDCERLLNSSFDKEIIVNREELIGALDRMSIIAKTSNNLIEILSVGTNLKLIANTDIGNIEEELEVGKTGNDIKICVNYKYLLDIVKAIPDEKVKICLTQPSTPLVIRPVIESVCFDYLVMPIRNGR